MTDMRYMDRLDVVVADAVGLIREKTATYMDSWKRRGGPGAWFTTVRPIDRLEGIMQRHGGDIFAAIEADPTGQDGSALACVRDVMNYLILIEAHARVVLGVGPHGPARPPEDDLYSMLAEKWGLTRQEAKRRAYELVLQIPPPQRPGTPEDGGHHAVEAPGEVTQDAGETGDGPAPAGHADVRVKLGGFGDERLTEFHRAALEVAGWLGVSVTRDGDTLQITA